MALWILKSVYSFFRNLFARFSSLWKGNRSRSALHRAKPNLFMRLFSTVSCCCWIWDY